MDIDKIESVVEKAKLSSKTANYLIAVLILVVICLGGFIYELAKPEPKIETNNDLKFLNETLSVANDNISDLRKENLELREEIKNCKCK